MGDDDWTLDQEKANKDDKGNPIRYGKKGDGKPSSVNHGNVTPSLVVQKDKNGNPVNADGQPTKKATEFIPIGGFTIDHALQITTLSLPALRRLKFPLNDTVTPETNRAARTLLAALGLSATTPFTWELLDQPGQVPQTFALNGEQAMALLKVAIADAKQAKLSWQEEVIKLTPRADLAELVRKSYAGNGAEDEGDEE
jgi:CRISPR-associated protein Csb1